MNTRSIIAFLAIGLLSPVLASPSSRGKLSPADLRPDAEVLTTKQGMKDLSERYDGRVRIEDVAGAFVVVGSRSEGEADTHLATVEGAALDDLQRIFERRFGAGDEECAGGSATDVSGAPEYGIESRCSNHGCLKHADCKGVRCTGCLVFWCY